MRTIVLPDEMVEKAEAKAQEQGMTLEAWIESTVTSALGPRRAEFPIIESDRPGFLDITPETLRQIEHEDDIRRSGLLD